MRVRILDTVGDLEAGRHYLMHLVDAYGCFLLAFDGVIGTYTFDEVRLEYL